MNTSNGTENNISLCLASNEDVQNIWLIGWLQMCVNRTAHQKQCGFDKDNLAGVRNMEEKLKKTNI